MKRITAEASDAERAFLTAVRMVGLDFEANAGGCAYQGRRYVLHATVDDATIAAFGGKLRAIRLLRLGELVRLAVSKEPDLFSVLESSFAELVTHYPLLRSYFEAAKIGAAPHTWWRSKG